MSSWEAEISRELMDISNVLRGIKHELYQLRLLQVAKTEDERKEKEM